MFYKVVKENTIVDAMEEVNFVRQNNINKVIISCSAEFASGIVSSDGTVIWHLEGRPSFIEGDFESVKLVEIEENEYNTIKEVLVDESTMEADDERIREPMTTTEVLERLDQLQRQVDTLTEQNTQLKIELATLRG